MRSDENILGLIAGADLVIYDSTYTDEEFPKRVSWGHSTWEEGVRLCRRAGSKKLGIFHHDPDHDDVYMAKVAKEAKDMCEAYRATLVEGPVDGNGYRTYTIDDRSTTAELFAVLAVAMIVELLRLSA